MRTDAGGNWLLSMHTALRPLEEVPTKRRAMYRRRYAMLAELQRTVNTLADVRSALPETPVEKPVLAVADASTFEPAFEDDRR